MNSSTPDKGGGPMNLAPFPLDPIVIENTSTFCCSQKVILTEGLKFPSTLLGLEFFIIVISRYCLFQQG